MKTILRTHEATSMRPWIRRSVFVGLLAVVAVVPFLKGRADDKPDQAAIARWIDQLGDDDADKRKDAAKHLEEAREAAVEALQKAEKEHPDVDVRLRAGLVLRTIVKETWGEIRSFGGQTPGYWFNRVAFTADGKQALVTGGGVVWFDLESGKEVRRILEVQGARRGFCLSKDGSQFLTGHHNDQFVRLCKADNGQALKILRGHKGAVGGAALSADGTIAASGSDDKTLRIWNLSTGKETQAIALAEAVRCVAFAPKDNHVVVGQADGMVRLFEAGKAEEVRGFKGHTKEATAVAFTPDGDSLVTASLDGTIRVWNVEKGEERLQMKHDGGAFDVAVSPDGKRALSAGYEDKIVRVWDLTSGKELHAFTGHKGRVLGVAFSPDGERALSSDSDCTVKLWQLQQ
jgi:WD40 repeat protein